MCMTEQSELAYKAMDETAEWGAANRVVFLRRVHELEPHVMPEAPARSIHLRIAMAVVRVRMIASDFVAFWSFAPMRKKLAPYIAKAREFIEVFKLYAKHHNPIYAARMAYGIVVKQLPF